MIKNLSLSYPNFWEWLNINIDFNQWINLIEQPNGWWKSTMINTIHSFFTGKFPGLKTLPDGSAIIKWTINGMLTKNKWVGSPTPNHLYDYIIPWRFFTLSTVDQRKVFTELFKLDYVWFIKTYVPEFYEDIESDLKKKRNDYLSKEEILLSDIMTIKSFLINLEQKDFSDVESFVTQRDLVFSKVKQHNDNIWINIRWYNDLWMSIKSIETYEIPSILKQIELISEELKSSGTCSTCWSKLSEEALLKIMEDKSSKLELLNKDLANANTNLTILKNKLSSTIKPEYIDINDLQNNANKFLIQLPNVSIERYNEYSEYKDSLILINSKQKELKDKEDLLKTFDTIWIDKTLEAIANAKNEFTKHLESILKVLPFDIELFQVYKNWNIKPSFIIKKDWVEYNQLSTWNKAMIEIQIAKLFIDNLWLDFILIDEASHISKSNLDYIKQLSLNYQVILAKPTWWDLNDLTI